MTRKPPIGTGGTVVLVLLLGGVIALALRPSTESVVYDDTPPIVIPEDGTPVVHALRAPGGLSLFGLQIVDPTHRVEVQFLTGPDCAAVLDPGEPWPTSYPECSSAVDVEGEVGSLGNTGTGRSLVGVIFVVSGGCYDLLERGMPWPPADPECVG
ncbi:MAG TPA: hypothetical protein VLD62_08200 [Acidimicrobiia bacterium]|nr:hypothetical protein [Acidimicrobiia bacterium]